MHLKTEDEQEEISSWGIGPKLVLISLPFILFFSFLALYYPIFQFFKNAMWMLILGIIWTIFGFICFLISRRTL
ncbi:MAG: hypothetical protein ACFFD2_30375, partial [Promethearchaeota archaeon]